MNKLLMLKRDLQMRSNANDSYLQDLLDAVPGYIRREGIVNDGTAEYASIEVQYAAYLFRKRASNDTNMPKFLRREMNNLLFSQKARL